MLYRFYPWPIEVLKEWWPQEKKIQSVVLTMALGKQAFFTDTKGNTFSDCI